MTLSQGTQTLMDMFVGRLNVDKLPHSSSPSRAITFTNGLSFPSSDSFAEVPAHLKDKEDSMNPI